jgi:hypothetical protein
VPRVSDLSRFRCLSTSNQTFLRAEEWDVRGKTSRIKAARSRCAAPGTTGRRAPCAARSRCPLLHAVAPRSGTCLDKCPRWRVLLQSYCQWQACTYTRERNACGGRGTALAAGLPCGPFHTHAPSPRCPSPGGGAAMEDFGQRVDLTARIREVLLNYPEGTSILKEVCGTVTQQDGRSSGPSAAGASTLALSVPAARQQHSRAMSDLICCYSRWPPLAASATLGRGGYAPPRSCAKTRTTRGRRASRLSTTAAASQQARQKLGRCACMQQRPRQTRWQRQWLERRVRDATERGAPASRPRPLLRPAPPRAQTTYWVPGWLRSRGRPFWRSTMACSQSATLRASAAWATARSAARPARRGASGEQPREGWQRDGAMQPRHMRWRCTALGHACCHTAAASAHACSQPSPVRRCQGGVERGLPCDWCAGAKGCIVLRRPTA